MMVSSNGRAKISNSWQPLIQLRVPGRRSHWNDDQKDVIEAEEKGGVSGGRLWDMVSARKSPEKRVTTEKGR